jgi:hypothetical protein
MGRNETIIIITLICFALLFLSGCSVQSTKVETGCATMIVFSQCGAKITWRYADENS